MGSAKYLFVWPMANLRQHRWISLVSVLGIGGAAFVVATLLGFLTGYQDAVRRDVDRMGYDLLITAKGCPYEAATLMLRGGVGLRYMPDGVVERLRQDEAVVGAYPTLIHPVREPSNPEGMSIYKGVSPGLRSALGLGLAEGAWFPDDGAEQEAEGVVLGFEVAEFEQRHAGDPYLIPASGRRESVTTRVLGILHRTGTQLDGTVLLPLAQVQTLFQLPNMLTGVGVKTDPARPELVDSLRERYHAEPELQVVSLSQVEQALRKAMNAMEDVVGVLAWILALMAATILLNTTLLRTLGEHKRLFVLHAIGFRRRFIYGVALVENLVLGVAGAGLGVLAAIAFGGWSSELLTDYLPYAPKGDLVLVPARVSGAIVLGALVIGMLATLPPLLRIRAFGDLSSLRDGG